MRILIINPNTSTKMTDRIRAVANAVKRDDCEVVVTCLDRGPITIESSYDEAYAIGPTIDLVKQAVAEGGYDVIILACFCEIGVEATREIADIPVLGLEEPTLATALLMGGEFAVMTEQRPRVIGKLQNQLAEVTTGRKIKIGPVSESSPAAAA